MKKALCATSPFSQPAPHHVTSPAGSAFRDLPRYALHPGAKRHPFTWPWAAMGPGRHMPASYQFFPMCNIRSKIALPRTFASSCVTSGKRRDSTGVFIAFESAKITPSNCSAALSGAKSAKIGCENCSAPFREPKAQKEGVKIAFCQDIDEGINWCSALWPNGGINFGRLAE